MKTSVPFPSSSPLLLSSSCPVILLLAALVFSDSSQSCLVSCPIDFIRLTFLLRPACKRSYLNVNSFTYIQPLLYQVQGEERLKELQKRSCVGRNVQRSLWDAFASIGKLLFSVWTPLSLTRLFFFPSSFFLSVPKRGRVDRLTERSSWCAKTLGPPHSEPHIQWERKSCYRDPLFLIHPTSSVSSGGFASASFEWACAFMCAHVHIVQVHLSSRLLL